MTYWNNRPASASHLRLFSPTRGWCGYHDEVADDGSGQIRSQGSKQELQSLFLNTLNATNLLLLTGSGASFCIVNADASTVTAKTAPGMRDLWSTVKDRVGDQRFNTILGLFPQIAADENIELLLTHCKLYIELYAPRVPSAPRSSETAPAGPAEQCDPIALFIKDAEDAILKRVDFVDAETELLAHGLMLQKIARRNVRKPRVKLFTTNYDLCFEYAAMKHRFVAVDGFSHSMPQVYDRSYFHYDVVRRDEGKDAPDYIDSVFHLYKLHGSLDWRRTKGEIVRSRGDDGLPVLIYPRSSKYQQSFEPPYLDMMGAFQTALREPDTALIVSGFGFNDDHISQPIMAAVEANMSLRIVLCDIAFLKSDDLIEEEHSLAAGREGHVTNPFLRPLISLAQAGDPRVSLINGRFQDMAVALPDLVAETERERHAARVRLLRDGAPGVGAVS